MAYDPRTAIVLYLSHLHVVAYLCFGGQSECHLPNPLSTGHLDLQGYVPDYESSIMIEPPDQSLMLLELVYPLLSSSSGLVLYGIGISRSLFSWVPLLVDKSQSGAKVIAPFVQGCTSCLSSCFPAFRYSRARWDATRGVCAVISTAPKPLLTAVFAYS